MGLLARARLPELEEAWAALDDAPAFEALRRPETGLVMVRGRAGGSGTAFNLGEMTMTRASVRLADGPVGHGYVAGRDVRHAELAALFDALMQLPARRGAIDAALLRPVSRRIENARRRARAKTMATAVDFFTLVRGEDEA
ncbi:MAG: phosphonate C-P lyase system protein PhnG [Alphaproteobacteria bacterium]|nr:phosphonate C-P lyase system protein PhnG [Alphaproteobacteria bacterium]